MILSLLNQIFAFINAATISKSHLKSSQLFFWICEWTNDAAKFPFVCRSISTYSECSGKSDFVYPKVSVLKRNSFTVALSPEYRLNQGQFLWVSSKGSLQTFLTWLHYVEMNPRLSGNTPRTQRNWNLSQWIRTTFPENYFWISTESALSNSHGYYSVWCECGLDKVQRHCFTELELRQLAVMMQWTGLCRAEGMWYRSDCVFAALGIVLLIQTKWMGDCR